MLIKKCHTVQETQVAQQSADISKKRRRLATAQKRAGELEKLICKIYEDNALGKLPDTRYKALDAQYAKEQDALEIEIAELEKAVTGYEQSQKSAEKFIALIDKYENFDTLTNTMLNEFVEKILVHERSRKGCLLYTSVEMLPGEKGAAPPLDRPSPAPLSDFRLRAIRVDGVERITLFSAPTSRSRHRPAQSGTT